MNGRLLILFVLPVLAILPLQDSFAQGEYHDIDWFEVIGYFISNPFLAIQMIVDQPNTDMVYETFANYRNNYINDDKLPTTPQLESLADKANQRVASKEFCQSFTADKVKLIIKAEVPYDKLNQYCNIPPQLDSYIRSKI